MTRCPVCGAEVERLAAHLVAEAAASDGRHVMWLNRNVTKHAVSVEELEALLDGHGDAERVRR